MNMMFIRAMMSLAINIKILFPLIPFRSYIVSCKVQPGMVTTDLLMSGATTKQVQYATCFVPLFKTPPRIESNLVEFMLFCLCRLSFS